MCHSRPWSPSSSTTVRGRRLFNRPPLAVGIRIPWNSSPGRYFLANEKGVVVADTCRCLFYRSARAWPSIGILYRFMTAMTSLASISFLLAWLAKTPRSLLSCSKYWSVASVMASSVSLSIVIDSPPRDRAKVDVIFLVIPVGKLGYGTPSREFLMILGAVFRALVGLVGLTGLTLSRLCSGSSSRARSR